MSRKVQTTRTNQSANRYAPERAISAWIPRAMISSIRPLYPRGRRAGAGCVNRLGDSLVPLNTDDEDRRAADLNLDGVRDVDLPRFGHREERVDVARAHLTVPFDQGQGVRDQRLLNADQQGYVSLPQQSTRAVDRRGPESAARQRPQQAIGIL